MNINIEEKEVIDALIKYAEVPSLTLKLKALKGIDWNPFDEDNDEYIGIFGEMNHNCDLLWDATCAIVHTAERLVVGGISLSNQQKHKSVVEALDRMIRVPFFLEPFDGLLIDMLVTAAVKWFNKIGWGYVPDTKLELKPDA